MIEAAASPRPNRRIATRLACLLTVKYSRGKEWHPATVVDLSHRGCRLRVGEDLPRDKDVNLLFERPLTDGAPAISMETDGTIVWARREGLSFQAGIQFPEEPTDLEEILKAIG
jgi:hypothetical protein